MKPYLSVVWYTLSSGSSQSSICAPGSRPCQRRGELAVQVVRNQIIRKRKNCEGNTLNSRALILARISNRFGIPIQEIWGQMSKQGYIKSNSVYISKSFLTENTDLYYCIAIHSVKDSIRQYAEDRLAYESRLWPRGLGRFPSQTTV